MFYTAVREHGFKIEKVGSIAEGKRLILEYEEQDKKDGLYQEGYYDIITEDHESLIYKEDK